MNSRLGGIAAGFAVLAGVTVWLARREVSVSEAKTVPASVVDSAIPREEALARFRVGLTPTDSLIGGASSREALIRSFVKALETRDTAIMRSLVLSKSEFAYVYYPTNPQGLPPYDLSPSLYWFLLDGRSRQGLGKAWTELGGAPLGYARTICPDSATVEGENTVYGPCGIVRRQAGGKPITERVFGPIIERRGRWKFVSYANKLD